MMPVGALALPSAFGDTNAQADRRGLWAVAELPHGRSARCSCEHRASDWMSHRTRRLVDVPGVAEASLIRG